MADVLTDEPSFPRNNKSHYILIANGYNPLASDLIERINNGLQQVPEEYRESAWVTHPGEDDNEWCVGYEVPESDESYVQRLAAHKREEQRREGKALSDVLLAKKSLEEAGTTRDKRAAASRFEQALRVAARYGIDTTPYE